VAGELQSFAISPSYGGPYAGIIATREKFVRQMPGRLVGQTVDTHGNRAFCLTLATREQHIRREKATSNICTNQALIALMATVFMTVYGKQGLRELALQNLAKAHYLAGKSSRASPGSSSTNSWSSAGIRKRINKALLKKKIIGGLPLGRFYPELADSMLLCATEMTRRADMDDGGAAHGGRRGGAGVIRKVRSHLAKRSSAVRAQLARQESATSFPNSTCPPWTRAKRWAPQRARRNRRLPEVSEVEAIRHFTRLSTWNYAIDHGMYPLGSCTMKYNPRINELVARIEGLAWAHPYQPEALAQGAMEVMARLEAALAEITGMDAVTLQPAAGAHGELTGILLIRALLEKRGNPRKKILIPDSAHGTNPATAAIAGYAVENIRSNERACWIWKRWRARRMR
jgi:glycine cleavage system protein P-like pyridoxal-binding family